MSLGGTQSGGFAGRVWNTSVLSNDVAYGNVIANGGSQYGGFVGATNAVAGTILESEAYGTVKSSTGNNLGGFVGIHGANFTITKSFARGSIEAPTITIVGGFASNNNGGTISESYTTATMTAASPGGFLDTDNVGVYSDNFWDITIAPTLNDSDGGAVAGITSDTTTNLQTQGTWPAAYDFATEWTMPQGITPGQGYPQLRNNYPCNAVYVGGAYSGAGTRSDPINICNIAQYNQLVATSADWSKFIVLADDIDFGGAAIGIIGTSATPFSGTFHGKNHLLKNFVINQAGVDNVGVFGVISGDCNGDHIGDGQIWSLKIQDGVITGQDNVGALAGQIKTSRIINSKIISSTIVGRNNVGGLIGLTATQWMKKDPYSSQLLDQGSLILRSFASADISATGDDTGGLVGENNGHIKYSASEGLINGQDNVGGLAGNNTSTGLITNGKAEMGSFTAAGINAGGIVGLNAGTVSASFSGNANPGAIGSNTGTVEKTYYDNTLATSVSAAGTGLTTAQSQDANNFPELDFHLFWVVNASYPNLKFEE